MTTVADRLRVCPTCGSAAAEHDYCTGCGAHLAALPELPTQEEWRSLAPAAGAPSVRPLLHPTESSRFVLAMLGTAVAIAILLLITVAAHGAGILPRLAVFVALSGCSVYVTLQLLRARLLGRSVKVTADTLPELQAVIDDVKATLHYHRKVDVYVVAKHSEPIAMTSFLGTTVVLIEGGLVSELMPAARRPQLTFLIGRSIGALRAKHTRLDVLVTLLQAIDALKFVSPVLLPWSRATTYSGDQIGLMCCGDFNAALEATRRLLVGDKLAAEMAASDVLGQSALAQRHILARFTQLFSAVPHVTNRYANLLCFGRYHDPELAGRLRDAMSPEAIRLLDRLWERSPYSRRAARVG